MSKVSDKESIKSKIRLIFSPSIFGWQYDISLWAALLCLGVIFFETCKVIIITTMQIIQTKSFAGPDLNNLFIDNFFGVPMWIFFVVGGISGFFVVSWVRE